MRKVLVIVLLLVSCTIFAEETKIGSYEYNGNAFTVTGEYRGEYCTLDGLNQVESIHHIMFREFKTPGSKMHTQEIVNLAIENYAIVRIYNKGVLIMSCKNAKSFIYTETYITN